MRILYYCEVNAICVVILLLFADQMRYKSDRRSSANRLFSLLLWTTVILCLSDMVAGICRGQSFRGAHLLTELSNMLFFEAISASSFLWMLYVFARLHLLEKSRRGFFWWSLPFVLMTAVILTNPLTHFVFTIDANNLYTRSTGIYIHWAVSWFYLLCPTLLTIQRMLREPNKNKRRQFRPFLYYIVAPAIAAVVQMVFYGVTISQVGITVSLVAHSLAEQNNQMLIDALTGLNNRFGFQKYCDEHTQRRTESPLFILLLDINRFKLVNDRFGHPEGDRALINVAAVIKESCETARAKLFSCRYGGDEFLIAGYNCSAQDIADLKAHIQQKLRNKNETEKYPYVLSVSIGAASGTCLTADDIDHLVFSADEEMYREKENAHSGNAE